ncbi:hypothetical protein [Acutalibacter sp. JLR.KK004]|uniref:hypothetical protein n=1 Tax=Acutalibacter sp. JLR.KK004 TaxID=3112622 RepID=UPI002FEF0481
MGKYDDILHMERPASKHPKMDLTNRAKLFSPFSALRGFDIAVLTKQKENALIERAWLSEDMQEVLERRLCQISAGDRVTVTYFCLRKAIGDYEIGEYVTETDIVEEVDELAQALVLSGTFIPFTDIYDLQGDFSHADGEQTETVC